MKSKSVKAIQFVRPGELRLVENERAETGVGELGIEVIASSLCNRSELNSFSGGAQHGYGSNYPMMAGEPGHEAVGKIVSMGENVEGFKIGDIVVMSGHGGPPAHQSYLTRKAETVATILPVERKIAAAATLEMFACAYHCLLPAMRQNAFEDSRVAIIGLGAIGFCALQVLRLWPAREICAVDICQKKLDLAMKSGADELILLTSSINGGDGVNLSAEKIGGCDVAIECSGTVAGMSLASALNARHIVNASYCPAVFNANQGLWFRANTTIYNPGIMTSKDLRAVANLYNRRLINPEALVSLEINPSSAEYLAAIAEIQRNNVLKAIIKWK